MNQPISTDPTTAPLHDDDIRRICLDAGADDCGAISVRRPELARDLDDILQAFPQARTLLTFVVRMNPDGIRSPLRSVANLEFAHAGNETDEVARRIIAALRARNLRGINPALGFPMEMDRFPDKVWVISLKHAAEAAGLGKMGLHRNLIHPQFGNFVLIGAVVTNAELASESAPIDENPCLKCNLCVAACPVGAIQADGHFDFSACYTHNYREFMGGFTDWAETVVKSRNLLDYRARVTDAESVSLWQSLSFGAQYKSAYCMAVCPAGEDVIPSFNAVRHEHVRDVVQPLREKRETLYVLNNSDAAVAVRKKPGKTAKFVGNTLRPTSIANFLSGLPILFQPGRANGVTARYHFSFRGDASDTLATVDIRDQRLTVFEGHVGQADVRIMAHGATWLRVLRKEASLVLGLLFGRIRVRGRFGLLRDFARCFPE